MLHRRQLLAGAATILAAPSLLSSRSSAASWPTKPVRIIVGFEPRGATDTIARVMGERLAEMWKQPVKIENMPGSGGNLGAEAAAKSDADGSTIFIVGPGQALNKYMYAHLSYDPVADFSPVSLLVLQPNVMAVPTSSPVKSVQEFIAYCKANPGKATYASSGVGTSLHLCGELFQRIAGVQMKHVPYQGSGPALNDFLPGRVDCIFDNISSILPHVMSGGARGLAVTTAKRVPAAPKLPTLIESGVPGFDVSSWFAFFVPDKTPKDIVAKLHADTIEALKNTGVKEKLEGLGCEIVGSSEHDLAVHLKAEMDRWGPVIRDAKIRMEN